MKPQKLNIRVYGLIIEKGRILITDEYRFGIRMAKFPGGGLKLGEGPVDCLKREIREETGAEITAIKHFYTTEFFQPARFVDPPQQLLNIYYTCDFAATPEISFKNRPFDFDTEEEGAQTFRWVLLDAMTPADLTLPVDKVVLEKLKDVTQC